MNLNYAHLGSILVGVAVESDQAGLLGLDYSHEV
jgi:hypothetical protein